jgi:DNA-binding NtrC family response regulator
MVDRQTFDVVLCDVVMDGMSGLELLDRVKRTHPALPFIVITGAGGIQQAVDATKRGAFEYVVKPFDADLLRSVVASALDGRLHPGEAAHLSSTCHGGQAETRRHRTGDANPADRHRLRRSIERTRACHG